MKIVSVGDSGTDIIVTLAIPKEPLKVTFQVESVDQIIVDDITQGQIVGYIKDGMPDIEEE